MSSNIPNDKPGNNEDFLSLDISVGDSLQLQDFSPLKHRYHVKLIGYLNKSSLIVTHPSLDELPVLTEIGDEFLVRGFSDAKTYEFNATVLNKGTYPYPYLHLSFPEHVGVLVMRGAMRIKTKLPCTVVATAGGIKMPAKFNDLSTSGASIQSAVKLGEKGESIQLNFRMPVDNEEQSFVMSAIIRNVGASQEDNSVMYGVQFSGVTNRIRIALQTYVYTTLIQKEGAHS